MSSFPSLRSMRWKLFWLGWLKIPLIGFCRPRLVAFDEEQARVRIPLRRRTRNHLGSMYFGALMVGGDLTAGLHAYAYGLAGGHRLSIVFKSVGAEFLRRPESDVTFVMDSGQEVGEMVVSIRATTYFPIENYSYGVATYPGRRFLL